ncbi:hypothetical protein H0G69_10845 (plasmid) [Limosilactobacillus mucosae]|uniref:hypothetical protein n=1 Tax=Limosilactobacillus mucosae TaxID=97478 RepID=UPI0015D53F10|nr:hypothetical protein [Limosilactobacillus mucosae]QLI95486.1 hypothetical protein H0G69_10845 [Limosilactobacillus mucosae]
MASIKAAVWSLLSGGFVYLYMTNHFIKANWVALIWIVLFALQTTISATKKKALPIAGNADKKTIYKEIISCCNSNLTA